MFKVITVWYPTFVSQRVNVYICKCDLVNRICFLKANCWDAPAGEVNLSLCSGKGKLCIMPFNHSDIVTVALPSQKIEKKTNASVTYLGDWICLAGM